MSRTTTARSVRGAARTEAAAPTHGTKPEKAGAEPSSPRPSGGALRHALEGGLAVMAAIAAMSGAGYLALRALGADGIAPLTRLVPAVTSLAFGGRIGLAADLEPKAGAGGGMLDMLGGGGGLSLGVAGQVWAVPLMLTFLGAAVLGWCFFRPLRRRMRPAPALLVVRTGGALGATAVIVPVLASLAHGTLSLPESVSKRLGKGGSGGGLGKLTGGGISSVDFTTDIALTVVLSVLGVALVIGLGCVAARRTSLPGPVALSRARLKWNPVASTLTGIFTSLCTVALFLALLAGAAAATGRGQAAKAAGALLLAAPNLISAVLTSGLGASWEAGMERRQPEGGGMMGGLGGLGGMGGGAGGMGGAGGFGGAAGSGADGGAEQIDLSGKVVAGLPLWLTGLTLLACLLVYAGYRTAARTPARTTREESDALLGRHLESAVRAGVAVGLCVLVLGLVTQVSVGIGFSLMGNEMGGMDAGLDGSVRLPALTGSVLAGLACYAGSRLHAVRAGRPGGSTGSGRARRQDTPIRSGRVGGGSGRVHTQVRGVSSTTSSRPRD
ncbi:streptophobe family protein [Streptomyces sp. NBC_00893]|uniref:streptophobe family protein n=1 Tax=Streptomyces sp. NBC_00893 TaxID=2975862 RepID=UPI0022523A7F|nr:streptophobe family protein [Streptomyces sp. NBC_00893]MCX4844520.1 streptophobe family protein [Streptomyces sp. NBC_00893]